MSFMDKSEKSKTLRTFIAIEISSRLRNILFDIIKILKLKKDTEKIKWTKKENLHLTLCFIGNLPIEKLEELIGAIQIALQNRKTFHLLLGEIEHFPPKKARPHALVQHLSLTTELLRLVKNIEQAVASCNLPVEQRPYLPHITLGRLGSRRQIKLKNLPNLPKKMLVKEIVLYRSDSSEQGSVYTPLLKISLT